jgi:hypothetical protein
MNVKRWLREWLGIERDLAQLREEAPRAVEATVLRIKPGDVLLLRTDEILSDQTADGIKRHWEAHAGRLGITTQVIVLSGLRLQILRQRARAVRRHQRFATGGVVEAVRSLVGEAVSEQILSGGGQ